MARGYEFRKVSCTDSAFGKEGSDEEPRFSLKVRKGEALPWCNGWSEGETVVGFSRAIDPREVVNRSSARVGTRSDGESFTVDADRDAHLPQGTARLPFVEGVFTMRVGSMFSVTCR